MKWILPLPPRVFKVQSRSNLGGTVMDQETPREREEESREGTKRDQPVYLSAAAH